MQHACRATGWTWSPGYSEKELQTGHAGKSQQGYTLPPIKGLRHSSFSLILLCGPLQMHIILRSTLQSWFHYPHFIKEGTQTPINNFLMVTHTTISGKVGVRLKLQSWDSKACVLSIPVCVREEGKFLKSYFGKIE